MGWTASDRILESPTGFFHAAGGGFDCRRHPPGPALGISIKPFPSGSNSHPAMSALLRLIRARQIERLDVGTDRFAAGQVQHGITAWPSS